MNFYYNLRAFIRNLKWMLPAAWKFRPWDSHYNIELFADSLEQTSKCLKNGHFVNSAKYYKRCLFVSKALKKYYNDLSNDYVADKSYQYLNKNNPSNFEHVMFDNHKCAVLKRNYKISEDYYIKMFKLINDRVCKADKERKKELWLYINKYIPYWWD